VEPPRQLQQTECQKIFLKYFFKNQPIYGIGCPVRANGRVIGGKEQVLLPNWHSPFGPLNATAITEGGGGGNGPAIAAK
jgi:hypothetical protein